MRVLLVDERGSSLANAGAMLTGLGHGCRTALSAGDAIMVLEEMKDAGTPIELLFTSIETSKVDREAFVRRAQDAGYRCPVIWCSFYPRVMIGQIHAADDFPIACVERFFESCSATDEEHLRHAINRAHGDLDAYYDD